MAMIGKFTDDKCPADVRFPLIGMTECGGKLHKLKDTKLSKTGLTRKRISKYNRYWCSSCNRVFHFSGRSRFSESLTEVYRMNREQAEKKMLDRDR